MQVIVLLFVGFSIGFLKEAICGQLISDCYEAGDSGKTFSWAFLKSSISVLVIIAANYAQTLGWDFFPLLFGLFAGIVVEWAIAPEG